MPKPHPKTQAEKKEALQRRKQRKASIDFAWKFRAENQDLPISPKGMAIWFDPSGHLDGTLNMTVQIPWNLTWRQYRDAWPTIQAWRQRLTHQTGEGKPSGSRWIYEDMARLKKTHSFAQTANILNERLIKYVKAMQAGIQTKNHNSVKLAHLMVAAYFSALHVRPKDLDPDSHSKKLSPQDINNWYSEMFELMSERRPSFSPACSPITETHVRERLRQFIKKQR